MFFLALVMFYKEENLFWHWWHKEQVVAVVILEVGRGFQSKMPGNGKNIGYVRSGFPIEEEFATG